MFLIVWSEEKSLGNIFCTFVCVVTVKPFNVFYNWIKGMQKRIDSPNVAFETRKLNLWETFEAESAIHPAQFKAEFRVGQFPA